jgi:hypothetical protein
VKESDARVEDGHKLVLYVEGEDHKYGPMVTGSYMTENYIDDFMEKRGKLRDQCLAKLKSGEISPVSYYMTLLGMGEADLAARAGVSRRKLRRHMTPRGFAAIPLRLVTRYAEIFGVPVCNMFQVVVADDNTCTRYEKTSSPHVVVTHVDRKTP